MNEIDPGPNFRWDADVGVVSILTIDHCEDTFRAVKRALWMWPHHVHLAGGTRQAIEICDHFPPNALVAAAENGETGSRQAIVELRKALPEVPIIALSSRSCPAALSELIGQGADAALYREQAVAPALHNLLGRVHQDNREVRWPANFPPPRLQRPWLNSEAVGALVCDISGTVIDANQRLATWLGHHDRTALIGKVVWRDLLYCAKGWAEWQQAANALALFIPGSWTITGPDRQILTMQIDVFAAEATSKYLHVTLLDHSKISSLIAATVLADRSCHIIDKRQSSQLSQVSALLRN